MGAGYEAQREISNYEFLGKRAPIVKVQKEFTALDTIRKRIEHALLHPAYTEEGEKYADQKAELQAQLDRVRRLLQPLQERINRIAA